MYRSPPVRYKHIHGRLSCASEFNHVATADPSEDATNELRVKTVKYFISIEKVQDEVEAKYGPVASVRLGLSRATAA